MAKVITIEAATEWELLSEGVLQTILWALETGQVVFFPYLAFPLVSAEALLFAAATAAVAKNISFDAQTGRLGGIRDTAPRASALHHALSAFAQFSRRMLVRLLPSYEAGLVTGRTSFRPAEIAGRDTSWRKDDTRLHVDSFPATPVHGRRILRFFTNVDPQGKPRCWRIGEPFPDVAARFLPYLRAPVPGCAELMHALHITKTRRSAYDSYMLQLHDRMKSDLDYQARAEQTYFGFPPGSSWMVYTDLVSHAAMSGQHAFEQTFYLPVERMNDPSQSPLRILERMTGKRLVEEEAERGLEVAEAQPH